MVDFLGSSRGRRAVHWTSRVADSFTMMIHYTTLRRTRLCTRIPARYRRSSSHQVLVSVVPQQFPFESRTLVLSSTYVCSCLLARSSLRASISPRRPHHAESTYEVPGGHCSMQVLPLFSWKLWPLDHRSHSKRSGSGGGGGGGGLGGGGGGGLGGGGGGGGLGDGGIHTGGGGGLGGGGDGGGGDGGVHTRRRRLPPPAMRRLRPSRAARSDGPGLQSASSQLNPCPSASARRRRLSKYAGPATEQPASRWHRHSPAAYPDCVARSMMNPHGCRMRESPQYRVYPDGHEVRSPHEQLLSWYTFGSEQEPVHAYGQSFASREPCPVNRYSPSPGGAGRLLQAAQLPACTPPQSLRYWPTGQLAAHALHW